MAANASPNSAISASLEFVLTGVLGTLKGFRVGEPDRADVAGPESERVLDEGCIRALSRVYFCAF